MLYGGAAWEALYWGKGETPGSPIWTAWQEMATVAGGHAKMTSMAKATVMSRLLPGDQIECVVTSPEGHKLTLTGGIADLQPSIDGEGSQFFVGNQAIIDNAWAFAKLTYEAVAAPEEELQEMAAKRAKAHKKTAEHIASIADDVQGLSGTQIGWCSACFGLHSHWKSTRAIHELPAFLCENCGSLTLPCAAPLCDNMAVRMQSALKVPKFCAEHRHEISGFVKASQSMGELSNYAEFLEHEKPNLSGASRIVGASLIAIAAVTPLAIAAAPAIGGAVGTLVGNYSGAAATSYGLALLGGGPAAGIGFGMAGGTVVVGVLGAAIGGSVSASIVNAYVREDNSFAITQLKEGTGTPVILCNGFLTQQQDDWGDWQDLVAERYPDSPVYLLSWGAKELKDLGMLVAGGAAAMGAGAFLKTLGMKAHKVIGKNLGPVGPALAAIGLAKNPWHVAKNRANKTGVILADLLSRTDAESYVLIGHSLGARAAVVTAQTMGSNPDGPKLEAVHLLGAAIGAESDWESLSDSVSDAVYNYHSANDKVLKILYQVAELGEKPAGLSGFTPVVGCINNIDVSDTVQSHGGYFAKVTLR